VCQRSNDRQRNGRVQRSAANDTVRRQFAQSQSRCQKAHQTVNSDCPVAPPVRAPMVKPSWLGDVAGAPDSVRWRTGLSGAPIDSSLPTATLVVGAINTPQPPHFKASKFSANTFNTRALDFTPRHKSKYQILSKSQTHSKDLVACDRETFVFI
jgi:hypothetical protein